MGLGKAGVAGVVPHEVLRQEVDGVEVVLHSLALLQPSIRHLHASACEHDFSLER